MGYRSEVVLAITSKVLPQFLVTMAKSPEARALCYQHADERKDNYDGEGGILFRWSHIKWYEGYEPIDALCDFMGWCDDEVIGEGNEEVDADACYKFVRVGEDMDDNESRGYGFEDIYIERSVTY